MSLSVGGSRGPRRSETIGQVKRRCVGGRWTSLGIGGTGREIAKSCISVIPQAIQQWETAQNGVDSSDGGGLVCFRIPGPGPATWLAEIEEPSLSLGNTIQPSKSHDTTQLSSCWLEAASAIEQARDEGLRGESFKVPADLFWGDVVVMDDESEDLLGDGDSAGE